MTTATILDLPFVKMSDGAFQYWVPVRDSQYEVENATGRHYAEVMLDYIRDTGDVLIFGHIVRSIVMGRVYSGVEIGFCSRLNLELLGIG